jgi:hypothetical protein
MVNSYLRRYTDISSLISILCNREITLLNPSNWDDKNDSRFLALYKRNKHLKSVLALCFTEADDTYHHWGPASGNSSRVCIRFDTSLLLEAVRKQPDVRTGRVLYRTIKEMLKLKDNLKTEDLPFFKRSPYQDEREFRIIHESSTEELDSLPIPIPLKCITRITLSPWLPVALYPSLKSVLRGINEDTKLKIYRSTLTSNEDWYRCGRRAHPR